MTKQKIQIDFNCRAIDMDGFNVEVRGKVAADFEYRSNPLGLESDHPYSGHESGWYMGDLEWSDLQIDNMVDHWECVNDLRESVRLPLKQMKIVEKIAEHDLNIEFQLQN